MRQEGRSEWFCRRDSSTAEVAGLEEAHTVECTEEPEQGEEDWEEGIEDWEEDIEDWEEDIEDWEEDIED